MGKRQTIAIYALHLPAQIAPIAEEDWACYNLQFTQLTGANPDYRYYGFKSLGARNEAIEVASRPDDDNIICPYTHWVE